MLHTSVFVKVKGYLSKTDQAENKNVKRRRLFFQQGTDYSYMAEYLRESGGTQNLPGKKTNKSVKLNSDV